MTRRAPPSGVRIEIKQEDDGYWGFIYLFQDDPHEMPLIVGPCADRQTAESRARTLANDIASSDQD